MQDFLTPASAILHPTDFSPESDRAFAHALAIALRNKASLTILHVIKDREDVVPWMQYPSVRQTLERWGYLNEDAARGDVASRLGIRVRKEVGVGKNVADAITEYTRLNNCDLIVMSTDAGRQLPKWITGATAVAASESARIPTLFVPNGVEGCVNLVDGSVDLQNVVLAVDHEPGPQNVIDRIAAALQKTGSENVTVSLVHASDSGDFPDLKLPKVDNIRWNKTCVSGDTVNAIVDYCNDNEADLVAFVADGKKGFWDVFQGSTVQRVTSGVNCPVFTLPV